MSAGRERKTVARGARRLLERLRGGGTGSRVLPATVRVDRLTPWLFVGPALPRSEYPQLAYLGVTHNLEIRAEGRDDPEALRRLGIEHRWLGVVNDEAPDDAQIADTVDWLTREVLADGGSLYVHCQGGIGRAPTCSMALLMHRGYSLQEAHRRLLAVRPESAPSDAQMAWLESLDVRMRGGAGNTASQERTNR